MPPFVTGRPPERAIPPVRRSSRGGPPARGSCGRDRRHRDRPPLGPALGLATAVRRRRPSLPDLTFYGRGYGHGVGMSQYGARGRALAGQLAPEILAHYYPKTTLGQREPGDDRPRPRS